MQLMVDTLDSIIKVSFASHNVIMIILLSLILYALNVCTHNNSYLTVFGMHDRMHPNYWQITVLLVVDLCSSLAYFMVTQPASKLPIKTLVAKQVPTNNNHFSIVPITLN